VFFSCAIESLIPRLPENYDRRTIHTSVTGELRRYKVTSNPASCTLSLFLSAVVLLSLLLVPTTGSAQLSDVVWSETAYVHADNTSDEKAGVDTDAPEPLSAMLTGSSYSIDGSVSFASPGPPNSTTTMNASYVSGLAEFLGGAAACQILFQFTVSEISSPPVSINTVPVTISATGSAEAGGDSQLYAEGEVIFSVGPVSEPLIWWTAVADNSQGQASDFFDETTQIELAPGASVNVNMANASELYPQGALQPGTSANCTAYVDPVFTIADELIPGGGGATYGDHYEVQVSPGFWALGQVPVEPTSWGRIKRLFVD
jgi:hypothetical protein